MIKPYYKYNFRKRTILYFIIGLFCVSIDFFLFIQLSKFINPIFSNPICYFIGSFFSFILNKNFTFKSQNSKLSFIKYIMIILSGLFVSQLSVFFGLRVLRFTNNISFIKLLSILFSAGFQYLCSTFFGSSNLISNDYKK